jgi:predicted amidohydrolase YtcJ
MGVWGKAIGARRMPNSFAWASLLAADASLVFSSDWPACIDVNPIRGIHVAVNRRTPDGIPEGGWIPEQRIPIAKALLAYTHAGAYASFEENRKGQLKPGMLADVVVLSNDLFVIDPMEIAGTKVVMTILDGKVIYEQKK